MKNQTKWVNVALKIFLGLVLTSPVFSSCANLDEVWEKFDEVDARLDSLENGLNGQIEALNSLLSKNEIEISKYSVNEDGSCVITLSDGTEFTVLSKTANMTTFMSYKEVNGIKYWAVYDAEGNLNLLKDANNKNIPVTELPTVTEKDGIYYIVINGEEYATGYNPGDSLTLITSYELNKDESGNVYSVTFVFGEDEYTFTVPVSGYKGFRFLLGNVSAGATVIKDYYVDYSSVAKVYVDVENVVDYVMQIPDGWRVKEVTSEVDGTYLEITAPSKETITAGAAVAEGDLKVVAVVEGGDAMVARLKLTTSPFKTFRIAASNVIIEKYNGVDKVIYGISTVGSFDEDAIMASAPSIISANDKNITDDNVNAAVAEVLGSEPSIDERYVLWAVPVFYATEGEEAGYYVKDNLIFSVEFGAVKADLTLKSTKFNNATIAVDMKGVEKYYGGTALKTDDVLTDILYQVNNELVDPFTSPMTYEGSAFEFPTSLANSGVEIKSNSTYVTWLIPVSEDVETYTVDDVVLVEFTLPDVVAGGTSTITFGDASVDKVSISVPITSEGAERIYYVFVTPSYAKYGLPNEADKQGYLLNKGTVVNASSATASEAGLDPLTERVLIAMSVDSEGKYGAVASVSKTTEELVFNSMTVTMTADDNNIGQKKAVIDVSVSGTPVEYVWWYGKETDEFWTDVLGADIEKAGMYMALYPNDSEILRAMNSSSFNPETGELILTGLKGDTNYRVAMIVKDESGLYSSVTSSLGSKRFKTMAADLGTIVTKDKSAWKEAKNSINIKWHENKFYAAENSNMSAFYAFDITIPSNLTAYILCMSDEYFAENPETQTIKDQIIDIESQCSRKYDAGKTVYDEHGESIVEPDWVDDNGEIHSGFMLNIYDFYVHGYPKNGFATYFAAGAHDEKNCTAWEGSSCSNYDYAMQHITKRHSVDYYKSYVISTRGSVLKVEANINKAAQDLFEAYYPYYKDAKPLIYINNGEPLYMENHYASGVNDDGKVMDDVYVVLKDAQGNYYEPMSFEVPNYFK